MKIWTPRQRLGIARRAGLVATLALLGAVVAAPTAEAQSRRAEGRRGEATNREKMRSFERRAGGHFDRRGAGRFDRRAAGRFDRPGADRFDRRGERRPARAAVTPRRPVAETKRPGTRSDRPARVRRVDRAPVIRTAPTRTTDRAQRDRHRWSRDHDRGGARRGHGRWDHRRHRDGDRARRGDHGRFFGRYGRPDRTIRVPVGAVVLLLPRHHEVVQYRGKRLFYHQGAFYRPHRHGRGYIVVPAPYGVEVPYLADGYTEVWRDGVLYYHSHGIHYRPIRRSGITFFLSVRL